MYMKYDIYNTFCAIKSLLLLCTPRLATFGYRRLHYVTLADENGHSNIVEGCEVAAKESVV